MPMRYVLFLTVCILSFGCGNDGKPGSEDLQGYWEVIGAYRDGKPTHTLDGAKFRFTSEQHLATNITGKTDSAEYELVNSNIHHHGHEKAVYHINRFEDGQMELNVELRGRDFYLNLEKVTGD